MRGRAPREQAPQTGREKRVSKDHGSLWGQGGGHQPKAPGEFTGAAECYQSSGTGRQEGEVGAGAVLITVGHLVIGREAPDLQHSSPMILLNTAVPDELLSSIGIH